VIPATLSADRPRVLAVISVATHTQSVIEASGRFAVQLLDESQSEVVARFALPSPDGEEKGEGVESTRTQSGIPLVAGGCGFAECVVVDRLPTGDRIVYLADVVEEQVFPAKTPLRESAALSRQPDEVAQALSRSHARDVRRDDALIRRARQEVSDPEALMRLAIDKTREGMARGQGPMGCAIARDGAVLAVEHNRVFESNDITAHAELEALRRATQRSGSYQLPGAVVAATCEPCPMCAAALHFARVEVVYFGAGISDAEAAGFPQLPVSATALFESGGSATRVVPDLLAEECRALLREWRPD
jgi:tRNA(Arg) A34 adenosine deaminase TadA/flavin reductase (DIM6/NTAB) family NADH-FMN oxidoreductase RutF